MYAHFVQSVRTFLSTDNILAILTRSNAFHKKVFRLLYSLQKASSLLNLVTNTKKVILSDTVKCRPMLV